MIILKLTLRPTKTHVVDMGQDGFDFLRFHFLKKKSEKSGKLLPYISPSQIRFDVAGDENQTR
jgi:hypothetical protein